MSWLMAVVPAAMAMMVMAVVVVDAAVVVLLLPLGPPPPLDGKGGRTREEGRAYRMSGRRKRGDRGGPTFATVAATKRRLR